MNDRSETTTTHRFDVVVLGGGIAGLVAGNAAAEAGARVLLLDAHPVGGRARSTHRAGFTLNQGPHALYLGGALAAELRRSGVSTPGGAPPLDEPMGVLRGELSVLPTGPGSLARTKLLSMRHKARFARLLTKVPKLDPAAFAGRSLADWTADEPDDVAAILQMLVRVGTFVHAPDLLDAGAAIAQVQSALDPGVHYLHGGFQSVTDGLLAAFHGRGGAVRESTPVAAVSPADVGVVVTTADGEVIEARAAVVAIGGPAEASRLLGVPIDGVDRIGDRVTVSVLDLGLRGMPARMVAFGIDEPLYFSTHAPAADLAPAGHSHTPVMRYLVPGSDETSSAEELRAFARLVGVRDDQVVLQRFLNRLTVTHGFPTAAGGGLAGRPSIDAAGVPGVFLAGDWVGPEGMLSDAAAASGRAAAEAAVRHGARVGAGR